MATDPRMIMQQLEAQRAAMGGGGTAINPTQAAYASQHPGTNDALASAYMAQQGGLGALQPGMTPMAHPLGPSPEMVQMALAQGKPAQSQWSPYGALQFGGASPYAPPNPPDYNALLQQHMVNQQAEQAMQARHGMGAPGMGADPYQAQRMQHMGQAMHQAARQSPYAPMGFGAGMRPPGGMGGAPGMAQPANTAQLPGGGVQSALGQGYPQKKPATSSWGGAGPTGY